MSTRPATRSGISEREVERQVTAERVPAEHGPAEAELGQHRGHVGQGGRGAVAVRIGRVIAAAVPAMSQVITWFLAAATARFWPNMAEVAP